MDPLSKPPAADLVRVDKYQVLPCMTPDQFEALKADIAERGMLTPIDIDEHGNVLDGHHRYRACVELGLRDFPTIVRPGLTEEGCRMFARKSNMLVYAKSCAIQPFFLQLSRGVLLDRELCK